jgi:hypothetical protein
LAVGDPSVPTTIVRYPIGYSTTNVPVIWVGCTSHTKR